MKLNEKGYFKKYILSTWKIYSGRWSLYGIEYFHVLYGIVYFDTFIENAQFY